MRFYNIIVNAAAGGAQVGNWTSSSDGTVNGTPILGAQRVELDIPYTTLSAPINQGQVTIHGVSPADISQANNLNGQSIMVLGGMMKGLPLATAQIKNAGLLAQGLLFKAYGNWIGTDRTLNFILQPGLGLITQPVNLVLKWKKGTTLASAITATLTAAFPTYKAPQVSIQSFISQQDETEYYDTVSQFAQTALGYSRNQNADPNYLGVQFTFKNNQFFVFDGSPGTTSPDGSTQTNPKQIAFTDLIGQPTWYDFATISFSCVMRSDIAIGSYVKLPPAIVTTTAGGAVGSSNGQPWRSASAFQGTFLVTFGRHIGDSRSASGEGWITNFQAVSLNPGTPPSATPAQPAITAGNAVDAAPILTPSPVANF